MKPPVTPQPWAALQRHTAARIALGRAGASLTQAALNTLVVRMQSRRQLKSRDCHRPFTFDLGQRRRYHRIVHHGRHAGGSD